jgi:hypothetical protein
VRDGLEHKIERNLHRDDKESTNLSPKKVVSFGTSVGAEKDTEMASLYSYYQDGFAD